MLIHPYKKLSSKNNLKAGITIYLTLMLTVSMALIFTLVESGRVSAVNAKLRSITYMAADSAFAEFARPLFERYGVMFLYTDEEGFLETINDYITSNIDMAGTGILINTDLYEMSFNGSELSSVTWATDRDGDVLADQICEYMKYHAPQLLADKLFADTEFFEKAEETRKSYEKMNDENEDISSYLEEYKAAQNEGMAEDGSEGEEGYTATEESGDAAQPAKSADFIKKVNKQFSLGIIDLLGKDISDKGVETKSFPSKNMPKNNADDEGGSFLDKSAQKALLCEYIAENMTSYTKKKNKSVLDYEMEYILGGKESDRANLSYVVRRLILLRCGSNLISLLADAEKKAEIQAMAAAIVGWTAQAWLVKLMEGLITFAWALAEAMLDVKGLMEGKKVAVLKQKNDWNISISGLENYVDGNLEVKDNANGIKYDDYLKILLMMQNARTQKFRIMDVMEMNMRAYENADFRMKDCIAEVKLNAAYKASALFSALIPSKSRPAAAPHGYSFSFTQKYSYQPT